MKDELEQLLKNLHLRRVAELFEEESKRAEKQKPTYEEFCTRLLRAQWQRWSLAASILAVVGAGLVFLSQQQPGSTQFAFTPAAGATLPASHPLATTLSETASGTTRDWPGAATRGGTVYPVLSFRDGAGALCREFEVADGKAVSVGVACRRDAGWNVEAIATVPGRSAASEGYVPAPGDEPAAVAEAIDRLMQGEALDAAAEAAALAE